MNDLELDELIAASISELPDPLPHEAVALLERTKPEPGAARKRSYSFRLSPTFALGALLLLTAGGTLAAYQLSVWPWTSLPEGSIRSVPIPVDFTTEDGRVEHCRAYIELRNASDREASKLNRAIELHDWSGFGQELRDRAAPPAAPEDFGRQDVVGEELHPALIAFVQSVLSEEVVFGDSGRALGIGAIGMSCVPDEP